MKLNKFNNLMLSLTVASSILIGCGGSAIEKSDEATKEEKENIDKSIATKIILNKIYKDTVSKDDQIDYYKIDGLKANHEYYFHLKNVADRKKNPATTYVSYTIEDIDDTLIEGKLSRILGEKTYPFVPKQDGTIYIKFDSKYSLGNYDSRYEFEVKYGFDDNLTQDNSTFEYNDFKKVAYPIKLNKTYKSSASGTSDPSDWYVLDNMDSSKEYYFHLQNIGDKSKFSYENIVQCEIVDSKGIIKTVKLTNIQKEATYKFTPIVDGKVYLHFYTYRYGAIHSKDMRYSFDVK